MTDHRLANHYCRVRAHNVREHIRQSPIVHVDFGTKPHRELVSSDDVMGVMLNRALELAFGPNWQEHE